MSLTVTQSDLLLQAYQTLGVLGASDTLPAALLNVGSPICAQLVDSWNVQALTVLSVDRHVYDLVAGTGGPSNPYTLGPGGDFDTGTAARPTTLRNANLLLNTASDFPTEIPLAILTDDMWANAQPIKTFTNQIPTEIYYNLDPLTAFGKVYLYFIPDTDENQLVLYFDTLTPQFVSPTAAYVCPPSYARTLRLCLADELADFTGVNPTIAETIHRKAVEAMSNLKASNFKQADLEIDPAMTDTHGGTWNIYTDTGA